MREEILEGNPRILVVDDEKLIRIAFTHTLAHEGFEVRTAEDSFGAERLLQEEAFDVVFVDIVMPVVNGLELLKKIKATQPETPVILFTGVPSLNTASDAVRLDAYDYLTKPVSSDVLVRAAKRAIGTKRLREENRRYRQNLERLIEERTKELRESEERYRHIYDYSPVMMHSIDEEGRIINVNLNWLDETGYTREDIIGHKIDSVMTPKSAKKAREMIAQFWRDGYARDIPYQFVRKDGSVIDVLLNSVATTDPSGKRMGISIGQNVTEHKRAQKELTRLKKAIEQSTESVIITDPNGTILYVNPAFEAITGYGRDEAIGEGLEAFQDKLEDCGVWEEIREPLSRKCVWQEEFKNKKKDGAVYMEELTISPITDSDGEIINYVVVKRDVTEKRRLESIGEAANLMDNIGFVFSGIRHEIGNPINSLKTTMTVLERKLETFPLETTREFVTNALSEIGRVEYLLKTLKNFSLFESPDVFDIMMDEFMESFVSLVEEDLGKRGIRIEILSSLQPLWGRIDPRAFQQVMLNLVTNAAEALEGREDPRIVIGMRRISNLIEVEVQDNGWGMSNEQQADLFRPFFTSKPEGTGLGLVIVKRMLANMNSTIEISSQKGLGTIVTILLPEAQREES